MKKLLLITLLISFAVSVQAESSFYGQLNGYFFENVDDFDSEQSPGLTFGYAFNDKHAIEAEMQINGFDSTRPGFEVDADVFTYLLNYKHTFYRSGGFSGFAGAGLGFADTEFGTSPNTRGEDVSFVWQANLGAKYKFDNDIYVSTEIRLQDFQEIKDNNVSYDIGTPVIMGISLGYDF